MKNYLEKQNLLAEFVKFAESKGVKSSASDLNISKNYILHLLNAYITRNIFGDEGFYPLYFQRDETVLRALVEIKKLK
jgi:carboxyl-terminal processing protease